MGLNRSHLILLGPPGAGKGTQATLLSRHLGVPHISTGDILREEARKGSPLGAKAKAIMDKGELVPDDVMLGIVRERLAAPDCAKGFVLDGFPRSVPQAEGLEKVAANGSVAVSLDVPMSEVVRRLAERRTCRVCSAMYHLSSEPPAKSGVCDRCGGELYQRDDDREDVVQARLEVYRRRTEPLLTFYRERGALVEVPGTGSTDTVFRRLVDAVEGVR